MRTGSLPWWADLAQPYELKEALGDLIQTAPTALARLDSFPRAMAHLLPDPAIRSSTTGQSEHRRGPRSVCLEGRSSGGQFQANPLRRRFELLA